MIFKRKDKETEREMKIINIKKHSFIAGKYNQLNGRLEFLKLSLEYNNQKRGRNEI